MLMRDMAQEFKDDTLLRTIEKVNRDLKDGNFEKALEQLEWAEKLRPGHASVLELLAITQVCYAASKKPCTCWQQLRKGKPPDWYQILQVDEKTDDSTIKKKFRQLALLLHPDKNKHFKAEESFKLVSEAYACLSDRSRRRNFNLERSKMYCSCSSPKVFDSNIGNSTMENHMSENDSNWMLEQERLQIFRERARARVASLAQALRTRRRRWDYEMENARFAEKTHSDRKFGSCKDPMDSFEGGEIPRNVASATDSVRKMSASASNQNCRSSSNTMGSVSCNLSDVLRSSRIIPEEKHQAPGSLQELLNSLRKGKDGVERNADNKAPAIPKSKSRNVVESQFPGIQGRLKASHVEVPPAQRDYTNLLPKGVNREPASSQPLRYAYGSGLQSSCKPNNRYGCEELDKFDVLPPAALASLDMCEQSITSTKLSSKICRTRPTVNDPESLNCTGKESMPQSGGSLPSEFSTYLFEAFSYDSRQSRSNQGNLKQQASQPEGWSTIRGTNGNESQSYEPLRNDASPQSRSKQGNLKQQASQTGNWSTIRGTNGNEFQSYEPLRNDASPQSRSNQGNLKQQASQTGGWSTIRGTNGNGFQSYEPLGDDAFFMENSQRTSQATPESGSLSSHYDEESIVNGEDLARASEDLKISSSSSIIKDSFSLPRVTSSEDFKELNDSQCLGIRSHVELEKLTGISAEQGLLHEQKQKSEELLKTLVRLKEEAKSVAETLNKLRQSVRHEYHIGNEYTIKDGLFSEYNRPTLVS